MEEILAIGIASGIFIYLLKKVLSSGKKRLIAFDFDGVFTKGDYLLKRSRKGRECATL